MRDSLIAIIALLPWVNAVAAEPENLTELGEVEVVEAAKAPVALLPLDVTTITSSQIEKSAETSVLPVLMNKRDGSPLRVEPSLF